MLSRAVQLLSDMIAVPSLSRDEAAVSHLVSARLESRGIPHARFGLNLVAGIDSLNPAKPILMLNSHLDTVKPAPSYTFDPFAPFVRDGRLYGLGANDAGASVVSLIEVFDHLRHKAAELPVNLLLALTVEEEVGGEGGMRLLLPALDELGVRPDMVIVGEPTGMQPATAERGLVVLDCVTRGVTGHAARTEGINAIYRAIADIELLRSFQFPRVSEVLGPIKISVTQIEAGRQHNVVPDECRWVADVRTTDAYTNEQTARLIQNALSPHTQATPRSTRVQASVIGEDHPLVHAAVELGLQPFVSPTTSDMSLLHGIPSLKMGPGDSSRSHAADEYILLDEIAAAIPLYIRLITNISNISNTPAAHETLGQGL